MSVIEQLATTHNRRDESLNVELAKTITDAADTNAIKELVDNLSSKTKGIPGDCIKVLYEIGELKPALISGYTNEFAALLTSKDNRLQWGAMTALNSIASHKPELIYSLLPQLATAADKGSVITQDHYIAILIKLCAIEKYAGNAFTLLNEQLLSSPTNQLPMYAENALPVIHAGNKAAFAKTLTARLTDIEKDSKRKRVEKVLQKLQKR